MIKLKKQKAEKTKQKKNSDFFYIFNLDNNRLGFSWSHEVLTGKFHDHIQVLYSPL